MKGEGHGDARPAARGGTRRALGTLGTGLRQLLAVRWIRALAVVLVLFGAARLTLGALLAWAVNRLAEPRELVVAWEDLDLDLFSGRGEVRRLAVRPRAAEAGSGATAEAGAAEPEPLVEIEYALFDLELLPLLVGELHVLRAEVDGLDARVERDADGRWNLARHVQVAEVLALLEGADETEPEAPSGEPEPLDLRPPLAVEALRLQHARLTVVDLAADPPVDVALEANLRLSDLGDPERPMRFSLSLLGGELLDGALIEGRARWSDETDSGPDRLNVALHAQAGSLRLGTLAPYLAALDLRPAAETIELALGATLEIARTGAAKDAVSARLALSGVHLVADGREELALDRLSWSATSLSAQGAELGRLELEGVRGALSIEVGEALHVGGLELLRPEPRSTDRPPPWTDVVLDTLELWRPERLPRWASLLAGRDPGAFPWSLEGLSVRDGAFALADRRLDPPAAVPVELERFELGEVVHDASREPDPIPLVAELAAPGFAQSLRLEGELLPFAPARRIDLELALDGIELDSVAGYLARAGLEEELERASFHARLVGEATTEGSADAPDRPDVTRGWIELREVALRDEGELFGVRTLAARGLVLDPSVPSLELGEVVIEGPRLSFVRDASDRLVAFGLHVLGLGPGEAGPAPAPGSVAGPAPAPRAPSTRPPVLLRVGRFAWTDSDVEFLDQTTDPPTTVSVDELGFELLGLTLGGDPGGPEHEPARFDARVVAPGLLDELGLSGEVRSRPGAIDLTADLELHGSGLRGDLLAPYLAPFGIEPTLSDGRAALDVELSVREPRDEGGRWSAGLRLANGELADGDAVVASLGELDARELRFGGGGGTLVEVGSLAVSEPFVALRRDAEGGLRAGGLRLPAPAEAPAHGAAPEPAGPLALPVLPAIAVTAARVEGLRVSWSDALLAPPLELELELDAEATELATDGSPAAFTARLALPGALDALELAGELRIGAGELALATAVAARGVRAGPLATLLPPGLALATSDGRLAARIEARVADAAEGGLEGALEVKDLRWSEGDAEGEPLLACDALAAEIARFDPARELLALGPVRAEGVRLGARRDAEGVLHALGLRLGGADAGAGSARDDAGEGAAPGAPGATGATDETTGPGSTPAASAPGSALRLPFADVELRGPIQLELERLTFADAGLGPDARPLELGLRFALGPPAEGAPPAVVLRPGLDEPGPIGWSLEAAVPGLVRTLSVAGEVTPFAAEPTLTARLDAEGVRTRGAIELVPALGALLDGELEEGTLGGELRATLFVHRARPTELGLGRPFGAELALQDLAFRAAPDGPLLAGLESLHVDVERVDAARGLVHVDTVELRRPSARLVRDASALHAFGFALPLAIGGAGEGGEAPAEGLAPDAAGAGGEPGPGAAERAPAAPAAASPPGSRSSGSDAGGSSAASVDTAPAGEVRVDDVLVSGLDFELTDTSVEPPLRVALVDLDAELSRFTTRALSEPRPLGFSAYVTAADEGDGPLFDELALAGRVALFPAPSGWAQVTLGGLELTRFGALASQQGVAVEDGALDAGVRLRLRGERGVRVDTTLVFTDLALHEEENGPLQSSLGLSVPLETALFLLRSPDGEHRLSVGFTVKEGGVSRAQLVGAATRAAAEVLARAIAAVPFRLLGGLFGGGGAAEEPPRLVWSSSFAPGSTELAPAERAALEEAQKRLSVARRSVLVLRAELSAADLARAAELANPGRKTCLQLVAGLRQRRAELARRMRELAIETRALYAVGAAEARASTDELHALAAELDGVERSLDGVLEILRSDSPRQRAKRTRSAARRIAELRLEAARELIERDLPPAARERLDVRAARGEATAEGAGRVVAELRDR